MTQTQADYILTNHEYRNELYHVGLAHEHVIYDIAVHYHSFACSLVWKLKYGPTSYRFPLKVPPRIKSLWENSAQVHKGNYEDMVGATANAICDTKGLAREPLGRTLADALVKRVTEEAQERRRGFLVKLAIATVVAAAGGGVWLWRRREPAYQGKSLNEWLVLGEQYGWSYQMFGAVAGLIAVYPTNTFQRNTTMPGGRVSPKPEMAEVEAAIHAMGTKSIPPMVAMLETKDPAWKLKLMAWLGKQSAVKVHFTKAETYQQCALIGLTVLGPLATNAVPAILKAMGDTNKVNAWEFQAYAREALEKIGGTNSIR